MCGVEVILLSVFLGKNKLRTFLLQIFCVWQKNEAFSFRCQKQKENSNQRTNTLIPKNKKFESEKSESPKTESHHLQVTQPFNKLYVLYYRDRADSEGEDVGERGDGDGHAGVLHRQPDPLHQVLVVAGGQIVPTLHYHEHVVDPDA